MSDVSDLLYTMVAMVLFSILVNNSNATLVNNTTMLVESELEYNAIALAQSLIDEARTKPFDQVVANHQGILADPDLLNPGTIPQAFTTSENLGPESGEVYPNFNDFDDYNGLVLVRDTGYGPFTLSAQVFYANPNNPAVNVNARTTSKRMVVIVTHEQLPNPIILNYLKTYY